MRTLPNSSTGPNTAVGTDDDVFGKYSQQFLERLATEGYSPSALAHYRRRIGSLAVMRCKRKISLAELTAETAVKLIGESDCPASQRKLARHIVERFVGFLIERGAIRRSVPTMIETPRSCLRREYEHYLRHQRGLSEASIYNCWRLADRFLSHRFGSEPGDPGVITQADIVAFLQHLHGGPQPLRVRTTSSHLRALFRFFFHTGKIRVNLSLGIPSVARRYGARLCRHLTPDQVHTVLASIRSVEGVGRRNYAMALLMARLGLRAPEVVAMQLDDIDWRCGELVVRGKGQRHDRLPLPPEVGEALADYIRSDRKTNSRSLFVVDRAPHQPFKNGQILNIALRDAFAKTGVKPPAPYVGSHVLRHSLAVDLAQHGASLDEIADTLRHRSRASPLIYAKLDVEGLRSVARPWPTTGGAQ